MSSSLPTTPIGKQQLIDMRAGAILRGHARKSERYLGCPVRLLLTFIVLIKSSLICAWLVREYYFFDFGCSVLPPSFGDELLKRRSTEVLRIPVYPADSPTVSYLDEEHVDRFKREVQPFDSDPRMKSKRGRKKSHIEDAEGIATTVVSMTKTQLLPAQGDNTLRMKTIRNRIEPMSDVSADEDTVEIDIDAPPRVYISKIRRRGQEEEEPEHSIDEVTTEKPKKKKGKGRKKKKKKLEQQSSTSAPTTVSTTKKRKGHRKKHKDKNAIGTEQTKSPRHLFSPPGVPHFTTPRPHQSSFLHGVIDPKDPQFSNRGQIRGYPMHIASRKPTPSTRLSEETRRMWEMDELNYTTYASAPKTTVVTEVKEKEDVPVVIQHEVPTTERPTTVAPPLKSFYATHTFSTWKMTEGPPTSTTPVPISRVLWIAREEVEEAADYVEGHAPKQEIPREKSTLEQLHEQLLTTPLRPDMVPTTPRARPIKHGFDRSLDKAIDEGLLAYPNREYTSNTRQTDYDDDSNFQLQLSTFSSSAACIARTMFDLWCVCQLMTLFPYFIGVCVAHRSLFVSHLVLDILLLVIGFVYTVTMIVFSIVLYVLVGEMPKETLFQWMLFALVLDAMLLLYACLVVISLRCCERIVQSRLSLKAELPRISDEAQPV